MLIIYNQYGASEKSENDLGDINLAQSTVGVPTMPSQTIP